MRQESLVNMSLEKLLHLKIKTERNSSYMTKNDTLVIDERVNFPKGAHKFICGSQYLEYIEP